VKTTSRLRLLFLGLCLPSLAAAQSGVTLLVKTDLNCDWRLDGELMGWLTTEEPRVVLVSPGEHVIVASTADGVATIRTSLKVDKVEGIVDLKLKSEFDRRQSEIAAERTGGALAPTWTDPVTGLMWARQDNGSDVDWPEADAYCSKLKLANHSDWRLPTLEELQQIYDPDIMVRQVFDNGVAYYVHVKGDLRLTGWHWSSSVGDGPGQPWQWAWLFQFTDARRSSPESGSPQKTFLHFSYSMRALCVRSPG
jgi:hypothetical protein